ncbi:sugar O-acetyltransferase [Salinispirillum sp. LH 10-3-1]|uniref:Nodulation protein L n=1 Tax=Salinispirillum sp. LH 10-3-1 TaxID=2952525 RepID=A0AB38YE93_9GAMM
MSETENMLNGAYYNPMVRELTQARHRASDLCREYNQTRSFETLERKRILKALLGAGGNSARITPPFYCDYGAQVQLGKGVFFNANCVVLDAAPVRIGAHTLIGPAVQIYTVLHPMDAETRRTHAEKALPVTIGDDVWIGGGAIICPGVTIGARTVIGAGSVVTRDLPADVFAAGNPCRVVRSLMDESPLP